MTEISSFVSPYVSPDAPGVLGVSLHDIAVSLEAQFAHVKRRFIELQSQGEFSSCLPMRSQQEIQEVTGTSYTREVDSFFLSMEDAKFFVTQYQNHLGRAYCRYLVQREKVLDATEENLKDPEMARRFAVALMARADAQIELERSQAVVAHVTKSLSTSQVRNGSITREKNKLLETVASLKDQVGEGQLYRSVKGMLKSNPECIGSWTESRAGTALRKLSLSMGLQVRKIPDPNWGEVNAYHKDVWAAFVDSMQAGE